MKSQKNRFVGLTGVALSGFFANLDQRIRKSRVVNVELRPNGRITPEWVIGWAARRGYSAEKLQNGHVRVGVVVSP